MIVHLVINIMNIDEKRFKKKQKLRLKRSIKRKTYSIRENFWEKAKVKERNANSLSLFLSFSLFHIRDYFSMLLQVEFIDFLLTREIFLVAISISEKVPFSLLLVSKRLSMEINDERREVWEGRKVIIK